MNTALKIIYGALGLALLYAVVLFDCHEKGWLAGGDNIQSRAQIVTGNAQQASANVEGLTATAKEKAAEIDVAPLNDAFRNVRSVTGDSAAITANVRGNIPKINKAAFLLWEHSDRTLGHFDKASQDEQAQQKQITGLTIENLTASKNAIEHFDQAIVDSHIPLVASHIQGAAVELQGMAKDGHTMTTWLKDKLTAPKRWYQKLNLWGEAAGIWGARHL